MIEVTRFFMRDDKGGRITTNINGRGPSAHWYCSVCNTNFSGDEDIVEATAHSHMLLHAPRVYVPDVEFYKENN